VEGSLAIINVDIFRAAPGKDVPYIVTLDTFVTDGAITIEFIAGISDPQINAIEVFNFGTPTPTPIAAPVAVPISPPVPVPVAVPIRPPAPVQSPLPAIPQPHRINCGSTTQVTDGNNVVWSADQYFISSGKGYNTCGNVTNNIYCTSRYFRAVNGAPFRYNIPVPVSNVSYQIRLHFAEQVSATCGI
jgi:Malectin domain